MEKIEIGVSSIDSRAEINEFTCIGDNCQIGEVKIGFGYLPHPEKNEFDTFIHDNVVIHDEAQIHKGAHICEGAVIREHVKIGEGALVGVDCLVSRHILPFESYDGQKTGIHTRALIDFLGMEKGFETVEKFIADLVKAPDYETRCSVAKQACAENAEHHNIPLQEAIGIIALFVDGN